MGFSQFLTILRARRAMILAIVLVVVASVAGITTLLPKRYQASASVMVDQKIAYANAGPSASGRPGDVITTQIDLLTSPAVALRVVEELKLVERPDIGSLLAESNVLKRTWWKIRSLFSTDDGGPEPELKNQIADAMLLNLSVKSNRDSFMIRVTYAAPVPEFAAAVADSFARSYLATVESLRAGPAKRDTKEFDERIRTLRAELEQAETKLANFQQKKGIVASDERLDLETGRLNELSAQLAMAQSHSAESQARQRQLREYLAGGRSDAPGEVWASPVVQQLRGGIAEREAKLSDLSQRLGPNHPTYQTAAIELQKLRGQLSSEMRAAAESAVNASTVQPQREGSLRSSMEQQRSRVLSIKNDRNTLAILQPALRGEIDASNLYVTRTELHELLAESYDRAGQRDSAAVHHRAVVRAWRRADPVFHARRDRSMTWLATYTGRAIS